MITVSNVSLKDVQDVYGGPIWAMWELLMGEQIHIGGFQSSMDLAQRAGITSGSTGVDLCCCTGAGTRFLVKFLGVEVMTGVDATPNVIEVGRRRCAAGGFGQKITLLLQEATRTSLPAACVDFVWGEDAWCYVADKPGLIREAARLVKPGGTIAFTDWVVGPVVPTQAEADRFLGFMKFPNLEDIGGYSRLLADNGAEVVVAEHTNRFAPCVDLYMDMVTKQHTYDALRILDFDNEMMTMLGEEMAFTQQLAHENKIVQAIVVARKE